MPDVCTLKLTGAELSEIAAHELYHIWFDEKAEIVPADIIEESASDRNELKANRFAAEFLVDKDLLLNGITRGAFFKSNCTY